MTNQHQLNPDALRVATAAAHEAVDWQMYDVTKFDLEDSVDVATIAAVSAYLAFAQPVVNSVEELDKLPMHSYVQGNDGFKHAKDWNGGWHLIVNRPSSAPHLSGSIELPARVLYCPEVES